MPNATITESALRRRAERAGLIVRKDRARNFSANHQGGYMVLDASLNCVVAGENYDLDLEDVANVVR